MNSISKLWRKLRDKAYRDGYTEAQLSIEMPFQIRAIRRSRGWTQAQLAERSGIPQARISHIEQPGRDPLSLRTLYRLATAFDVGLLVQFVPFSELVRREAAFDPETFCVPSFAEDQIERTVQTTDALVTTKPHTTNFDPETFRVFSFAEDQIERPQMTDALLEPKTQVLSIESLQPRDFTSFTERTPYEYTAQATG